MLEKEQKQLTVAIYCRVSTKMQSFDRQVNELKAYAERCGYKVYGVYTEVISGSRSKSKAGDAVMDLAHKRLINGVLVSELSRWGRNTVDLLMTVAIMAEKGAPITALNGPRFDYDNATSKLLLEILAVVAAFERSLLSERVKSGIADAMARGKSWGRKAGSRYSIPKHTKQVLDLRRQGLTIRKIAEYLRIGKSTVMTILKENEATLS